MNRLLSSRFLSRSGCFFASTSSYSYSSMAVASRLLIAICRGSCVESLKEKRRKSAGVVVDRFCSVTEKRCRSPSSIMTDDWGSVDDLTTTVGCGAMTLSSRWVGLRRWIAGDAAAAAAFTSRAASPIAFTLTSSSGAHGSAKMGNLLSRHPRALMMAPVTFTVPAVFGVPASRMTCVR